MGLRPPKAGIATARTGRAALGPQGRLRVATVRKPVACRAGRTGLLFSVLWSPTGATERRSIAPSPGLPGWLACSSSTGLRLVAITMRPCGPDTACRVPAATKNGHTRGGRERVTRAAFGVRFAGTSCGP
jgi:hypothetical protein